MLLFCVSCRDPGLMERVTVRLHYHFDPAFLLLRGSHLSVSYMLLKDEEAGQGGWFWNEQVGSYRPPVSETNKILFCTMNKYLLNKLTHCYSPISNRAHSTAASVACWCKTMIIYVHGQAQGLGKRICGLSSHLSSVSIFCVIPALASLYGRY